MTDQEKIQILVAALERAYMDAVKFLNDGDFKRCVTWDASYIDEALQHARQPHTDESQAQALMNRD